MDLLCVVLPRSKLCSQCHWNTTARSSVSIYIWLMHHNYTWWLHSPLLSSGYFSGAQFRCTDWDTAAGGMYITMGFLWIWSEYQSSGYCNGDLEWWVIHTCVCKCAKTKIVAYQACTVSLIVHTHAYIDHHSGIVLHICSCTSMCVLHTQVRVQLVRIRCVLPWVLVCMGELLVIYEWSFQCWIVKKRDITRRLKQVS